MKDTVTVDEWVWLEIEWKNVIAHMDMIMDQLVTPVCLYIVEKSWEKSYFGF